MKTMLVLGATGFVGREVVRHARANGWRVKALSRSPQQSVDGMEWIAGDADNPVEWADALDGVDVMVELVQPALPKRLSTASLMQMRDVRERMTRRLVDALPGVTPGRRPRWISVSGLDELMPDDDGRFSHSSGVNPQPPGFGMIGAAVRKVIEAAGVEATFVHLGTVYGPGKVFGERVLPGLKAGRFPVIGRGDNAMPIVHVEDAARALVHLADAPRDVVVGKSFIVADGAGTTQRQLLDHAADLLQARRPRRIPHVLAVLVAGRVGADLMSRHMDVDVSALLKTGFRFRYPDHRTGMPATVRALYGNDAAFLDGGAHVAVAG